MTRKLYTISDVVVCLNLDASKVFTDETGVKVCRDEDGIYYKLPTGEKTYINKIDLSDDTEVYRLTF